MALEEFVENFNYEGNENDLTIDSWPELWQKYQLAEVVNKQGYWTYKLVKRDEVTK